MKRCLKSYFIPPQLYWQLGKTITEWVDLMAGYQKKPLESMQTMRLKEDTKDMALKWLFYMMGSVLHTWQSVVGFVPGRVIWPYTPTFLAILQYSTGLTDLKRIPMLYTRTPGKTKFNLAVPSTPDSKWVKSYFTCAGWVTWLILLLDTRRRMMGIPFLAQVDFNISKALWLFVVIKEHIMLSKTEDYSPFSPTLFQVWTTVCQ